MPNPRLASPNYQFRPAHSADLPAIAHLRAERRALLIQSDRRYHALTPGDLDAWLADPAALVIVGLDAAGAVLAYATAWTLVSPYGPLPDGLGIIDEWALDAHRYHGGLGRALAATVCGRLRARAGSQIAVLVPRYHAVEQAFWRALGARTADTVELHLPPAPVTGIWLRLWNSP